MSQEHIDLSRLQPPKRKIRLRFGILTLLIIQLLIALFMWLRPDRAIGVRIGDTPYHVWIVFATYACAGLLFMVVLGLAQRMRPFPAFCTAFGLVVFACCLTAVAYFAGEHHRSYEELRSVTKAIGNPRWVWMEVFLKSWPGVWLIALAGGLGAGISFQEHPDL